MAPPVSSEEDEEEDRELDGLGQNIVLSSAAASRKLTFKLLMFRENRRPAYWGTWSKRCDDVTGRRPLGKAQVRPGAGYRDNQLVLHCALAWPV